MGRTAIEWATDTWNPFTGCDLCSAGCAYCYAKDQAASLQRRERGRVAKARSEGKPDPKTRYQADGDPKTSGPGFGFTVHWDKIAKPPSFTRGGRIFVNSMSDVFHPDAPVEAIAAVFAACADRPHTNFLILTKRPERMQEILSDDEFKLDASRRVDPDTLMPIEWPLRNVWLGTTIENRSFVDRAEQLRRTPAAVRFISAEPLLGPLVPDGAIAGGDDGEAGPSWVEWADRRPDTPGLDLTGIDWLIAGGESGGPPRRRLVDEFGPKAQAQQWVRQLRDECEAAGTAFFFKQWGGVKPTSHGRLLDGLTFDELPVPDGEVLATVPS